MNLKMQITKENCICAHVSVPVDVVVGEFQFLKGQRLGGQLAAGQRRVRVSVDLPASMRRVGLAGDHPRRTVVGVAVALAVDWHDVQQD